MILDHVNMFGYVNPSGWDIPSTIRALSIGTQPADTDGGPSNRDSTTNCLMSGPVSMSDFYGDPPEDASRFMWPTDYMQTTGCSAQLSRTASARPGRRWNRRAGSPGRCGSARRPAGDFVPDGSVGIGYVSPGYQPAS